jgi:uncharacterized protein YndB with AHSA1/START domain
MTKQIISTTPESEIISTRIFSFPIATVFRAWSDPKYLKEWWGPAGFTNTFHVFEFKVGGKWSFVMHGPDKGNYQNECEFIKIEAPSLIAWQRHSKPIFQVVVLFEEANIIETKVIFKMLFTSEEECNKLKKFVVDKNEENFDRLEQVLPQIKQT